MTFVFNANITPQSGADAVFQWKEFMKTGAGGPAWTVVASGDGYSNYSNSGDVITSKNTGANGMFNKFAWFVIQQPSSTRQFCFQSLATVNINNPANSSAVNWRIKYSTIGFTNGGSATVTPTANVSVQTGLEDAGVILGSALGTDSSPTGAALFATDGSYRMQMGADNAAPNSFNWFCTVIPTPTIASGFLFDAMATGTFPPADIDPYIVYTSLTGYASEASIVSINNGPVFGFIKKGLPGESFASIGAATYALQGQGSLSSFMADLPSNPYNNTDDLLPVVYARPHAWSLINGQHGIPTGYKGISNSMKWCTTDRTTLDMLSVLSPGDRIVVGNFAFPWNNTNPIL